jgi:hypothetical protein
MFALFRATLGAREENRTPDLRITRSICLSAVLTRGNAALRRTKPSQLVAEDLADLGPHVNDLAVDVSDLGGEAGRS